MKGRKGAAGAATGITGKNSGVANLTPYKPGQSGNLAGRPQGDGLMRKRLMKSFLANEKAAMAAMARRWGSVKHVQDMWELLAKLEGELTKEAGEGARGIQILLLNNQGAHPLDPEAFREAARRKGLELSSLDELPPKGAAVLPHDIAALTNVMNAAAKNDTA